MTRKIERDLDNVLSGETHPVDDDQASVAELAAELEAAFSVETPPAPRERSMFVHALAGRSTSRVPSLRFAIPATALMLLLALTAFFGRTATGGDLLFPVRRVMAEAGLATNPQEEIDRHLEAAEEFIDQAEEELDLTEARRLVFSAAGGRLYQARIAADQLGPDERRDALEEILDVEQEGSEVLAEIVEEQRKETEDGGGDSSGSGSDDSSGPGSGDDSSGSGSGLGDDSSGSGSGDDSSGSGSGSGDDSSGSGSGSGDSSGSGSGDSSGSGSGSGDSSGSGSGDDSSGSG